MKETLLRIATALILLAIITGAFYLFSGRSLQTSILTADQSGVLYLTPISDVSTPQEGATFMVKVQHDNYTDASFGPGTVRTEVTDDDGEMITSFTNGKAIDPHASVVSSITVPNEAGATYIVSCGIDAATCGDFTFTIPAAKRAPIAVKADIVVEEQEDTPTIDWKIVRLRHQNVVHEGEDKIKLGITVMSESTHSFESDLALEIRIPEDSFSLTTTTGKRVFDPGTLSTHYVYLPLDAVDKTVGVEAVSRGFTDSNLTNNYREITITKDVQPQHADISISHIASKIVQHEGTMMIKAYVGMKLESDEALELENLGLSLSFPYANEELSFDDIYGGLIEPNQSFGFTTYLPLSKQRHEAQFRLNISNDFHDADPENNVKTAILPAIGTDSISNIRIFNSVSKKVEQDGIEMIKLYFEFSHDGLLPLGDALPAYITNAENGTEIATIEALNLQEPLEPLAVYSWTTYLSTEEHAGTIVKITIPTPEGVTEPFLIDNSAYLQLAQ